MSFRRSIPTRYRGILFRSKLEADWARTFDGLGLEWEYEKEGHYFGDQFYLPDFWLPRAGQFVEVKPAFDRPDLRKVNALCRYVPRWGHAPAVDVCLVAAGVDGWFHGWPRTTARDVVATELGLDLALLSCLRCGGRWFAESHGSEQCRCCGHDPVWPDRSAALHVGYITPWPLHPRKAA